MKFIKAIVLVGMFICGASSLFANRTYEVTRENGGANGYQSVHEWHGSYRSTLDCSDPGFSACEWVLDPSKMPRIIGYADHQIALGVYSGTHTEIVGMVKCTVTWEASSTGYAHIVETQEDIGSVN